MLSDELGTLDKYEKGEEQKLMLVIDKGYRDKNVMSIIVDKGSTVISDLCSMSLKCCKPFRIDN